MDLPQRSLKHLANGGIFSQILNHSGQRLALSDLI